MAINPIDKINAMINGPGPVNREEYAEALVQAYGKEKFDEISKNHVELTYGDTLSLKDVKIIQKDAATVTKNDEERHEEFMRGFLGRMLFSGDEALKSCKVL